MPQEEAPEDHPQRSWIRQIFTAFKARLSTPRKRSESLDLMSAYLIGLPLAGRLGFLPHGSFPRYLLFKFLSIVVTIGTFPYYRIFHFNNLQPIRLIAFYGSQSDEQSKLIHHIGRWRAIKLQELQFISIAAAIVAAAVIGSFSWNTLEKAYWLTHAFWYSSLILSILAILLAAQQLSVLQLLGRPNRQALNDRSDGKADIDRYLPMMLSEIPQPYSASERLEPQERLRKWRPRWKMIFTWQCPIMFMSYSVLLFMAGLTILVCTPLVREKEWETGSNVAVVYLSTAVSAGAIFAFCSFWIYHYIDLDHGSGDITEHEAEIAAMPFSRF